MKQIDSQIFGVITLLEEEDADFTSLKRLVEYYPANGFGFLNKLLNSKSLMLQIRPIEGDLTPTEPDPGIGQG